jgi:hypothetical protein
MTDMWLWSAVVAVGLALVVAWWPQPHQPMRG